ncbi:MAG: glutamine-hydrolyzing GMP synthase [Methanocellales archaeon]
MNKRNGILILNLNSPHCYTIGRKIRELEVYSEIVPHNITAREIEALTKKFDIKGIILPDSDSQELSIKCFSDILNLNIPILGISYGCYLIAQIFNGKIKQGLKEDRIVNIKIEIPTGVLEGFRSKEKVFITRGDIIIELPGGFEVLAKTEDNAIAAFQHRNKPVYGVIWKPEVIYTENGIKMLNNFINICKCRRSWKIEQIAANAIKEIKQIAGDKKAVIALSGGIDSSTAAVLASKAIGRNLIAIFVDNGFLREDEVEFVKQSFKELNFNLIQVDARQRFLRKLRGIKNPEQKRKLIGEEFIRVFEDAARKNSAEFLIQGTIYTDRVESGSRGYDKIKTYHNVHGLSTRIKFKRIIEPLKDLYKDEIRKIAEYLGLPRKIVWRQPFPGPGLAIRIVGEVTAEKLRILRSCDEIVAEELEKSGVSVDLWQYFAILTNTKSTGIKKGSRAYGCVVAIRAVVSKEALTATFAKIPYGILENISTRITAEIPEVTRVVYDITHKPPSTIEWE